jgi:hypothetical protein
MFRRYSTVGAGIDDEARSLVNVGRFGEAASFFLFHMAPIEIRRGEKKKKLREDSRFFICLSCEPACTIMIFSLPMFERKEIVTSKDVE